MLKLIKNTKIINTLAPRSAINIRWFSNKDEDSSDDERKKSNNEISKKKSNEALKKLNQLLESMPTIKTSQPINIITAKNKRNEAFEEKRKFDEKQNEKDIKVVTKKIAEKIGGDVQKTEAELLSALLGTSTDVSLKLNDVYRGLKIESDKPPKQASQSRAQMVRNAMDQQQGRRQHERSREGQPPRRERPTVKAEKKTIVNLFGAKPLNIFEKVPSQEIPDQLETWSRLEKRELKLAVTHPPRNYFEKMILWTEQGKVWKFPIDNEQGLDEEKQIDFTEHVMLEMHLEDWCPTRGPVRHFMELVCVGLSKNNFLTAQEKKDHIMWYKEYFETKRDALGDLLTLGISESKQQNQIES